MTRIIRENSSLDETQSKLVLSGLLESLKTDSKPIKEVGIGGLEEDREILDKYLSKNFQIMQPHATSDKDAAINLLKVIAERFPQYELGNLGSHR